jgi:polyhydroxyalkanoate synthase
LTLFIDESQLALLDDIMYVQGFLDTKQMAGAFYLLRPNEMIFSSFLERYLLAPACSDRLGRMACQAHAHAGTHA